MTSKLTGTNAMFNNTRLVSQPIPQIADSTAAAAARDHARIVLVGGGEPKSDPWFVPLLPAHERLEDELLQLGRDATSSGDRVMAEGYFQHAEHYFRILNAMNQAAQQGQQQQGNGQYQRRPYQGNDEGGQPGGEQSDEQEPRAAGLGDQPEARDIPIAAAPPEV